MLDMRRKIFEITADISREDYDRNEILCFALTHLVQIIGEAAQRSHV